MSNKFKGRADRVRAEHNLHWLALFSVGIWAGTAWGWLWGIATLAALFVLILLTNIAITAKFGNILFCRFSRWAWLIAASLLIAISTATIEAA